MNKILTAVVATIALMGCGSGQTTEVTTPDTDSIGIEVDSIGVSMALSVNGLQAFPAINAQLAGFVAEQLFFLEDEEGNIKKPTYEGDLRQFLKTCAQQKWEELRADTFGDGGVDSDDVPTPEELAANLIDEDGEKMFLSVFSINIRKVYDTDEYVSWQATTEYFVQGTPHPSTIQGGVTFRKSDAHRLTRAEVMAMTECSPYVTEEGVVLPFQEFELNDTGAVSTLVLYKGE